MDDSNEPPVSKRGRRSKVARLIDEYELDEIGAELEHLWTAEENRQSLRDLADYFNLQLLTYAVEKANIQHLDGEVENTYRLLTDNDISSAKATRVQRRLERDGVDVESLKTDFVTYQAIRTYLKDHRGAEYTPAETDPLERETTNVQKLRGRMVSVTEDKLEQLRNSGVLTLGDFRTIAEIQVICEDCNTQYDVVELLDRGSCECSNN